MTADHDELISLAVRIWTAAEALDAQRGGDDVWRWTHEQVAELTRQGLQEDPDTLDRLALALEDRLEAERRERREEAEAP